MGIFDKAKDALSDHSEHVDSGIEKAGDMADERTGGKFADHVDTGQEFASDRAREFTDSKPNSQPEQPA